jgi:hypothetical protein
MAEGKRRLLSALLVVIVAAIVVVQLGVNPRYDRIADAQKNKAGGKSGDLMVQLPGQFMLASFTGFEQVVAGALWIRADDFFHRGQYAAIIPIVRMVTWLDPHNIDVYITGAWHLDYNFVDEANSLSDKRYIPASIALMKEGIRNNPDIWDLYFELGWTHYCKKMNDNANALKWISKACEHEGIDPNTGQKVRRYDFVDRMKAHLLEKCGRFDEAIAQWHKARALTVQAIEENKRKPGSVVYVDQTSLDLCDRNLSLLLMRLGWRYGRMDYYEEGLKIAEGLKSPASWVAATASARKDFESRKGKAWKGDVMKPLNTAFDVSWLRAAPQVLIIKGNLNLIQASEYKGLASEAFTHWYAENNAPNAPNREPWRNGSRVYWQLQDYDYVMPSLETFNWKIDLSKTIAWGDIYVGDGKFTTKIDMSNRQDKEMYPFTADKYKLIIWVTPEDPGMPDYVQDRVGWKGEAITDPSCLDTKTRPGFRMLRKEFILQRSDII